MALGSVFLRTSQRQRDTDSFPVTCFLVPRDTLEHLDYQMRQDRLPVIACVFNRLHRAVSASYSVSKYGSALSPSSLESFGAFIYRQERATAAAPPITALKH